MASFRSIDARNRFFIALRTFVVTFGLLGVLTALSCTKDSSPDRAPAQTNPPEVGEKNAATGVPTTATPEAAAPTESIRLSAASAPQPSGFQGQREPFWVKAEAVGELAAEDQWRNQYVIMVFRNGTPYYQRMIDPEQIQAGRPFDLALDNKGTEYTAAFVKVERGQPGRRLSNTISFTH